MATEEERLARRAALRKQALTVVRPAGLEELFGRMEEEVLSLRIGVAQRRDDLPNEAELIAKLEVYAEFGR